MNNPTLSQKIVERMQQEPGRVFSPDDLKKEIGGSRDSIRRWLDRKTEYDFVSFVEFHNGKKYVIERIYPQQYRLMNDSLAGLNRYTAGDLVAELAKRFGYRV